MPKWLLACFFHKQRYLRLAVGVVLCLNRGGGHGGLVSNLFAMQLQGLGFDILCVEFASSLCALVVSMTTAGISFPSPAKCEG